MEFVFISCIYAIIWSVVYFLLRWTRSPYLNTAIQRNNFLTVLHCFTVPVLAATYLLSLSEPFGYVYLLDDFLRHLFCASVGYYLVSLVNDIRFFKPIDKVNVFHHLLTMLAFLVVINIGAYPAYFAWILFFQATGVFYHSYVILKDTPGAKKETIAFWYSANFYAWVLFRFVLEGLYVLGAFYYEFKFDVLPMYLKITTLIFICISYYFNLHWLLILLKKRKINKKLQ